MASEVKVFSYDTKTGKKWGYRFEVASIDGVRQWATKRGFSTKGDAVRKGNEALSSYESCGAVIKPTEMSVSDFLDVWVNSLRGCLKATTVSNYEKKIRLYIKPVIGHYKLRSLSKNDIVRLLQILSRDGNKTNGVGLAKNTLTVVRGIMSSSLQYAVDNKLITSTPMSGKIPIPKDDSLSIEGKRAKEKPHVYIPNNMIDAIFERFPEGTSDHIPLMIGYKCGLRIGEAFAVCWEDIDFCKSVIHVRRQIQWHQEDSGFWYYSKPKYNSERDVDVDSSTLALLAREHSRQMRDADYCGEAYTRYYSNDVGVISDMMFDGFSEIHPVCVRRDGTLISPRTMQHTSHIIHTKLNYPEFDFHSLRHTHATMLVESGASPMYIQKRLGHKSLDVTIRYYFHLTDTMNQHGASIVEDLFGEEKSSTSDTNVEEMLKICKT